MRLQAPDKLAVQTRMSSFAPLPSSRTRSVEATTSSSSQTATTQMARPTRPTTGAFSPCNLIRDPTEEMCSYECKKTMDQATDEDPWFGIEQVCSISGLGKAWREISR